MYNFTIKHKACVHNVVADDLSRKHALVTSMQVQVVGFDVLKELYEEDADFGEIWKVCADKPFKGFVRVDGFLFKGNTVCILYCSLRLSILGELHGGALRGHFGEAKTIGLLKASFFWPKLDRDIARFVKKCVVCMMAKTHGNIAGLYTHCQFQICHGRRLALILCWDYLEHKETKIRLWSSLTCFPIWPTLYHATSLMMLRLLFTCTSKRLCAYMVFQ